MPAAVTIRRKRSRGGRGRLVEVANEQAESLLLATAERVLVVYQGEEASLYYEVCGPRRDRAAS